MKLRLPRRRIWRVAIYLVSLLLVAIAIDLVLVQVRRKIHPAYDTTRIIGPTLPDGSIDYLAAMENYFSRGVTAENNAAVLIFQALGRKALPPSQPPDGITNRLGMPHLPETGDYYVTYADYTKEHHGEDDFNPADANQIFTWPVTIKPNTVDWVKANEKPLALFFEASKRSRYFVPFNGGNRPSTLISVMIPHVTLLGDVRRAILTRALMRLNESDIAGFGDDIDMAHRLARLFGQDSTIIGRLIGVTLENSTCRVQRLALASGKLSPQQTKAMLVELIASGEQPSMDDCVNSGERFIGLDALQLLARANSSERQVMFDEILGGSGSHSVIWFRVLPVSYEDCMRSVNRFYDGSIIATRHPTYAQRVESLKLLDQLFEKLNAENSVSKFLSSDWAALILIPSLIRCYERVDSARMQEGLTEVALALSEFKAAHGTYPASLPELVPVYLASIPNDRFSDKPLIYSRSERGYTLYSVGPNMIDDGGKSQKPTDDVVANMP